MASGISIPIGIDRKNYDKETKQLIKDGKNLQKSLQIEYDPAKFSQAQKVVQEALTRTNEKATSLKQEIKKLESEGKVDTEGYKKLEHQLIQTETNAALLKKQLNEINQLKIDNLVNGFKNAGQTITSAGQALLPFSAAATAVIASLGAIASSAISAGDEIGTTAQQLNISTDALQKWLYIAEQTDVDSTQFVNAVTKMQNALSHLAAGEADTTATALEELGFTAEQAAKGMGENFEPIINALANVEDATMQAYYANELFGTRMAAKIIPLLNNGGEGLSELAAEFESLGYLSEDTVNDLDNFEDVIDRIKYQLNLVKNTIGASFLPLMESMASTVETKVVPALQKVADWFETLDLSQQKFLAGALAFAAALAPVLLIAGKMTSGIGSMIGMVAKLGTTISGLSASLGVIGLIAGVFALLYATNEDFRDSINNLISTIFTALKPVLDTLMSTLGVLMEAFMPIVNLLANLLVPIINVLAAALKPALSIISNLANIVLTMLGNRLEFAVNILTGLVNVINKYVLPVINVLSEVFTSLYEGIADGFDKAFNWIYKGLQKAVDFVNTIISKLNTFGDKLGIDSLSKLKEIDINVNTKTSGSVATKNEANAAASQAIAQTSSTQINESTSVDNSVQNITIEEGAFQVINNAEGIDAETLGSQLYEYFAIRLAKQTS
ncbi:MAG: hypothetical protein AB7E61_06405 [Acholeplasmataceae bacterium]